MPRKRLRPFLDDIIGDADLRASVDRIADLPARPDAPPLTLASAAPESVEPPVTDQAVLPTEAETTIVELRPTAFPPPPWEAPPELPSIPNGHTPTSTTTTTASVAAEAAPAVIDAALPPAVDPPPARVVDAAPPELAAGPVLDEAAPTAHPLPAFTTADLSAALIEAPQVADLDVTPPSAAGSRPVAPPDHAPPTRRRRRSASLLPPLPSPTDIPEDAEGRVAIMSLAAPMDDHLDTPAPLPADAAPAPISAVGGDAPLAGWLPVLVLGAVLVLVFIVGVLVTR